MSDKFVEDIKKKTEDLEIPESLNTENMIRKLKTGNDNKKKIYITFMKIGSVCAAGVLLVLGLTFAFNIEKNFSDSKTGQKVATADSYKEIYSYFDKGMFGDLLGGKTSSIKDGMLESDNQEGMGDELTYDYSKTNTQVEGVDEGDTVKTDGKYIYAADMYGGTIRIFDTSEELVKEVSLIDVPFTSIQEFYLVKDKLVIICLADNINSSSTYILTYDVTDRTAPVKLGEVAQDGYFTSSRMVDDIIYTFSSYYMYTVTREECVPSVNGKAVQPSDVFLTCDIASPSYQVITSMDINAPSTIINNKTILGNYSNFYVSKSNIYVASANGNDTQIIKLSFDKGIINGTATGNVKGYILNSYSMDEYFGNLRVVTTTSLGFGTFMEGDIATSIAPDNTSEGSNSLYVLNESLVIIGSIENIAPDERIYSARFLGDTGYFVTYKNMDPLFAVDLSNPSNPQILSELKITGFSEYLDVWSENQLLGIGQEVNPDTSETLGVKLSMFDISNKQNVTEINKKVLEDYDYTGAGYNHKSVLIDKEQNLIGFYAQGYMENNMDYNNEYVVYSYSDAEGFQLKIKEELISGFEVNGIYKDSSSTRGVYINDKLYIVNPVGRISVYSLVDYRYIGDINW